jgi:16S rRNA (guanine1516-N2)-methyltransferase
LKTKPKFCSGILAKAPYLHPLAQQLATKLDLPLLEPEDHFEKGAIYLLYQTDGLHIVATTHQQPLRFHIDFGDGLYLRRQQTGGKDQGLAKAVGIKQNYLPTVLDATAGFARDSFTLASLGCQVTLLERSPVLAAMLEDAIERASYDHQIASIIARMQLHTMDAQAYLINVTTNKYPAPDAIYLDPMFPERKKKAQVKKEMQILHQLLGSDDQTPYPLELALAIAKQRVVVKRPKQAEDLNNQQPSYRIVGKASRYDIYLTGENKTA